MFIVLLMVFLVSAEWVEISQNHYKKEPIRNALSDLTKNENNIYNNHSITEHQWSKGYVDRVSSIGDVQRQRTEGIERKPSVKIGRNPFHYKDSITMDTPKQSNQINALKSENSIRNNVKYGNRDNGASIQRIHQSTIKREHLIKDINILRNNFVTNNNIIHKKEKETETTNSIKIATTRIPDNDSEDISETLQLDVPDPNGVNSYVELKKRISQEKNKKISNDGQKHLPPKGENKTKETKNNGLDTLIKLIKIVSQTIQRGARRSVNGKVRYLEDLKMSLLASIEEHIESAFPDDTVTRRRRRSSDFHDSRGHVEFPSSESALMTISFLTFAVFLIKLVLQVIHTYKAKTMMVTPAVVATVGRAGNVYRIPSNN